jgi:hypothetical protein
MCMNRFFRKWYKDPKQYRMRQEEWLWIAYTLLASIIGFGAGLLIGVLWGQLI